MARDIIPTGYYKAQRYQGTAIVINENHGQPPVIPPGTVTDLYWASDAAGNNRVTTVSFETDTYAIVKTQDITASVLTLQLLSDDVTSEEMINGLINEQIDVPLLVQSNGSGFGFYKITGPDEDEMAFKNSTWQNVTSARAGNTDYTNNTGQTIAVSVASKQQDGGFTIFVGGVQVANTTPGVYSSAEGGSSGHTGGGGSAFTLVPAGAVYRVRPNDGASVSTYSCVWAELRKPA